MLIEAEVPALGYATYALRPRPPQLEHHPKIGSDRKLVTRESGALENEYLKVKIHQNGTFTLTDKATGRIMENMHYFTDSGEVGSAHISVKPVRNFIVTSRGCDSLITMLESSELRGVFKVELCIRVPAAASIDGGDRAKEYKDLPITYILTLERGSKLLKVKTKLRNQSRDHKLWVNFPSGVSADWAVSESAWDVAKRSIVHTEDGDNAERFYAFQPMQGFVDVSDGAGGLAFLSKGLREYEVRDDPERTISITLLRTHRAYMTANTTMNIDELDCHTGQHSLGEIEYEYGIYPHSGDHVAGDVLRESLSFRVDVKALQGVTRSGGIPACASIISLSSDKDVMVSAIKQSEDKNGIIVRLWNTTSRELNITAKTILPVTKAEIIRMDEQVTESAVDIVNGAFDVVLGPHKIVTVKLS